MLDICRTIFALNSLKFPAHSPHNLTNSTAHDRTICFFRQVRCRTIYDFLPHLNVASVTLDYQSYYLPVLITACLLPCLTALPAYLTICLSLTTYQSPYHVSLHACLLARRNIKVWSVRYRTIFRSPHIFAQFPVYRTFSHNSQFTAYFRIIFHNPQLFAQFQDV